MIKRLLQLIGIFLVFLPLNMVSAQKDTLFWFAAPDFSSSVGEAPVFLKLHSYQSASTVVISQPANGAFVPVTLNLPANSVDSLDLTPFLSSVESPGANLTGTNGIKITATTPITAMYEVRSAAAGDYFALKGTKGIGVDFLTPFQKNWANAYTTPKSASSIDIVATQNGTTVLITPRTNVVGHNANVTYSVVLNAGETYSVRDTVASASTSLAGSIVSSNNPVAVTISAGALSQSSCTSHVGDQITTTEFAGTKYIARRGNANDRVYVVAVNNNTMVTVTTSATSTTQTLSTGETMNVLLTDSIVYISSTAPVMALQVRGSGCHLSQSQMTPIQCAGSSEVALSRSTANPFELTLYTRSGFESQFQLNGSTAPFAGVMFSPVPGTGGTYVSGRVQLSTAVLPVNTSAILSNNGDIFGAAVASGDASTYTQFAFITEFTAQSSSNAGPDDIVCANTSYNLVGDVSGGPITGAWTTNGYGTFTPSANTLMGTYVPSPLDSLISPIRLVLSTTGPCPVARDTMFLTVSPAPIVNAGPDQTVCANNADVQLSGNVSGGTFTGFWTSNGTGTFSPSNTDLNAIYSPSPADIAANNLQLVLESSNNGICLAQTDTMSVTITASPVVNAGADTLVACFNNSTVSLNGSVSGGSTTGKWITTGSGVFSPSNLSLNASYTPGNPDLNAGFVTLILESTNNGDCIAERDSIYLYFTNPPVVNAGANLVACSNSPEVTLDGDVSVATTTGVWSGGNGTFTPDPTNLNAIYTPTAAEVSSGQVVLTLTSTNNGTCGAMSDNVQINFVAPPFANFNNPNVCLNQATNFTNFSIPVFGSMTSYQYTFGDGQFSTQPSPSHTYGTPGTYSVTLIVENSAGCYDTVTKPVTVYELPVADYSYSQSCDFSQIVVQFNDQSTSTDPITNWFYDFGGQGASATQNPQQLFVGYGDFEVSLVVQTANGCKDTMVKIVNIPPFPEAGFAYNSNNGANVGAVFNFIDTSANGVSWFWTFGDGNSATESSPSHTFFANGTYVVTQYVTSAPGCIDSASTTIKISTVTNEISTLIPNAISPNGDGKNDVWKLDFIELLYPNATVQIYNQWGTELFESTGYKVPWNGTYQGIAVPEGTYFYVINLNAGSDQDIYKGALLILIQD